MKKPSLRVATFSGTVVYFLGLMLVTTLSTYQGYSASIAQASFFEHSWKWIVSILFCWGLLLIFVTSARQTLRAIWALVAIIAALAIGCFARSHSKDPVQDDPVPSMSVMATTLQHTPEPIVLPQPTALSSSFQQAVMESGWYSILDLSRLQYDRNLIESYAIIKDTRSVIFDHLLKNQQKIHILEQRLYENEASAEIEENYIDAQILHEKQQKKLWESELSAIKEVQSIIQMLDANREGWVIQNGTIMFYSNVDTRQFENITSRIKAIAAHQKMLIEGQN
ncbi:hypothetical protein [Vibrio ezurae]|uniref:Uncharacterized protein n=1 Tax=Vibrio ezurae NBRC 102218 TaxID=1219080 RepID=U3B304_9VIBR|nr:hypothetical protein [Vibrio ezurae]GAD79832.1 hypothetical protein VEZ01S_20_01050 [Vibrio ezurae NBRC 102218]